MTIRFIGTGTSQGIPIIGSTHPVCLSDDSKDKRLRSAVLIENGDDILVIDCGPDFRQQMLANPVPYLSGILFTHEHNDHTAGLDDVRPFFFRQGAISIYAGKKVIAGLHQRFSYIFTAKNKYPSAPDFKINTIDETSFFVGKTKIIPIKVMHGALEIHGFRINDFAYITDAKYIAEEELQKLIGVKVLVVNALRIDPHPTHFNLEEALDFVGKVQPEKAYFTHISHLLGFHAEVQQQLPDNIYLAFDNLKITL